MTFPISAWAFEAGDAVLLQSVAAQSRDFQVPNRTWGAEVADHSDEDEDAADAHSGGSRLFTTLFSGVAAGIGLVLLAAKAVTQKRTKRR